jgi:hypothetical protein
MKNLFYIFLWLTGVCALFLMTITGIALLQNNHESFSFITLVVVDSELRNITILGRNLSFSKFFFSAMGIFVLFVILLGLKVTYLQQKLKQSSSLVFRLRKKVSILSRKRRYKK